MKETEVFQSQKKWALKIKESASDQR